MIEGQTHTVVVLQLNNEDYDDSQGKNFGPHKICWLEQEAIKELPITQDMQLLQYTGFTDDGESQLLGLAFVYVD